jgi:ABC-type bacteriocin/lantibiotic exporter with double-glycine peptidase domain
MKALNRMLYPRSDSGRRRYVRHALNPNKGKVLFTLLIIIGFSGMLALLLWLILDKYLSEAHFNLIVILVIVAMVMALCGVEGFRERRLK